MDAQERRWFKNAAKESLAKARYSPKKLILIHTGAMLALSLVVTLIAFWLDQEIEKTGGLGGLGTRSILTTVQSVLQLMPMLILPFWQVGYTAVTLAIARGKSAEPYDLTEGFRRFFPFLRLKLLMAVIYFLILTITMQIGTMLFMMTPWAQPFMDAIFAYAEDPTNTALEAVMNEAAMDAALPLLSIAGATFLAVAAPFYYKFRMAEFYLLEHPIRGAIGALKASSGMTRYHRMDLFKLDLSFWWFYLLDGAVTALCYGDILLDMAGVQQPWSADVAYFLFFSLYLVAQLALYWWRRNEVAVTYAHVYADLQSPPPEPQEPKHNPWG